VGKKSFKFKKFVILPVQGGVHYHGTQPQQTEKPRTTEKPPKKRPTRSGNIEEKFELEGGEYQGNSVDMNEGDQLVGFVEANGKVSAYLLGGSSLRSLTTIRSTPMGKGRPILAYQGFLRIDSDKDLHFVVSTAMRTRAEKIDPVFCGIRMRVEEGPDEQGRKRLGRAPKEPVAQSQRKED